MSWIYPAAKRALDIVAAATGLVVLSPVLTACALAVKMSSPGPVLFRHRRVGRFKRLFDLVKFRTMLDRPGAPITSAGDPRVTGVGRVLRRYKLDELPQLVNVLRGDMSLVGPRPEIPRYVEKFEREYDRILQVRPGITDFAAIEYRDEEKILARSVDPEQAYVEEVLPAKIRLYDRYLSERSLTTDLSLIFRTIGAILK